MTATQFKRIAPYYDSLMAGVPYRLWVDYVEQLLARLGFEPQTVIDLACGTGNVSEELARRGYDVVGVDVSAEMIEVARGKQGRVEYFVQDIAQLDLGRRFDLAVSLFDSLNYITDLDRLARAVKHIHEHLSEGGVFIFDVNTIYALSHHFFDQASLSPDRYPKYIWSSTYDHSTRICRVDMVFEVLENGRPVQFKEVHLQRGHSPDELERILTDAGFHIVDVFHAYKFRRPTRRSDRVFYVARRR